MYICVGSIEHFERMDVWDQLEGMQISYIGIGIYTIKFNVDLKKPYYDYKQSFVLTFSLEF